MNASRHPRRRWLLPAQLGLIGLLAILPAAPAAAAEVATPGTYVAKPRGGKVKVEVAGSLKAILRYSLRSDCGRLSGRLRLGKLDGPFRKRKPGEARVRGRVAAGGSTIKGKLKVTGERCNMRRRFTAELSIRQGLSPAEAGHYAGSTSEGLPFSFDLGIDNGGRGRISNLAYDVYAECYSIFHEDVETTMVAHVVGLAGNTDSAGDFDITVSEDPDPENDLDDLDYGVSGRVRHGEAAGDLELSNGLFDPLGILSPSGVWQCEEASFDFLRFRAARQ